MQREVEDARAAREAQAMLGHPTDRDFLEMVRSGMILNCPVTPNAVQNAHRVFGPNLAGVRGRTVRRPPDTVTTNYVQIPHAMLEWHQWVTLAVPVMFVNGVPFLVSMARGLSLVTAEHMPTRTAKQLAAGIVRVMDLYLCSGFQVGAVLMDNEFEKLQNLVPVIAVNMTAAKEHVPEVEQLPVDKRMQQGYSEQPPVQKDATDHACQANLSHCVMAERLPNKISSVGNTLTARDCHETQT